MSQDFRVNEEQNTRRRANLLKVKYFDTRKLQKIPTFEGLLTTAEMYEYKAVVLSQDHPHMIIAITLSTPQHSLKKMRSMFRDYQLSFVMISDSGFKQFMNVYDPPEKIEYEDIEIKAKDESTTVEAISETFKQVRSDDIFNYLVRQADRLNASDIHLERQEEETRIRFRVDGVLHVIAKVDDEKYRQLNSTLAIQANISSSSPDPQTGHMFYKIRDDDNNIVREVNMRIETVPTNFGQDAVIRLFSVEKNLMNLAHLGLNEAQHSIIDSIIDKPEGLVMSVGPTGSGKSTTLYSILKQLNTPDRKLITLEDPVEYTMPGVVQIPVSTDNRDSFASKLRAVLRLDPDVVMVGEIRDEDSARTALQAALSGHLVLSTFHANDTTAALSRLYDFLGDNPLLTSAIKLIVAQRLVRKLDEKTKEKYTPDETVIRTLNEAFANVPEDRRYNFSNSTFYKAVANDDSPFGYSGQTAVVEMLTMTPAIEKILHKSRSDLDAGMIRKQAIDDGLITLRQNAMIKAAEGITSLDEVFRVVG